MKKLQYFISGLTALVFAVIISSCEDVELPTANAKTGSTTSPTANFLFVNASPDAPSLNLIINNSKVGTGVIFPKGQTTYSNVAITANGGFQNTDISSVGSSGPIGGILGSNPLVYRNGNTNQNNLQAINGGSYTIFVVDTINRPAPVRKNNALGIGDTTFYRISNGTQISRVDRAALANASDRALFPTGTTFPFGSLVPLGTVPLGSTDVGGPRLYVAQDILPTFTSANSLQAAIRFVNVSPNSPPLWVRLKPAPGTDIFLAGSATSTTNGVGNFMSFAAFTSGNNNTVTPSVGSRTALVTNLNPTFTFQTIATAGPPITSIVYTLEVSFTNTFASVFYSAPVSFTAGKIYTVYAYGLIGKTDDKKFGVDFITHN
jgi:hypothetical protein